MIDVKSNFVKKNFSQKLKSNIKAKNTILIFVKIVFLFSQKLWSLFMNDFRNESKESILTKIELLNGTILMGTHARNHFKQLFLVV